MHESKCHNLFATIHRVKYCSHLCALVVVKNPHIYQFKSYDCRYMSVEHCCGSRASSGLGLQLGLHPPSTPLSVFAMLNDYAPAWSYLIPGVLSQRAKEFSLYISGRCLQKSSDDIWPGACQHCAVDVYSTWRGSYTQYFLTVLSIAISST